MSDYRDNFLTSSSQSFDSFKGSFSSGMNFIKRRLSISDELDEEVGKKAGGGPDKSNTVPQPAVYATQQDHTGLNFSGLAAKVSSTISAPTSPARHQNTSMYLQMQGITKNLYQAATGGRQSICDKEKCKCIFVVDDHHADWSKYFRGKKIANEFDIRVEQAEFSEMSLVSYAQLGCFIELELNRVGGKVSRSVQPDLVIIRQPVITEKHDYSKLVIGLLFGGVACVNSLFSIYNLLHKPWVFCHLLNIQRKLGTDIFPLINQVYYPESAQTHFGFYWF